MPGVTMASGSSAPSSTTSCTVAIVVFAVDLTRFLARSQFGAIGRGAEKGADARARSAQALGQIALGHQLQLQLATAIQVVKHIAVHMARKTADDLAHLARLEQRSQALVGIACVVVDH